MLGDDWVDRTDKNRNAFNTEWIDHITRALVRRVDASALRRAHAARPGDRHHDGDRPLGGVPLHVRGAVTEGGFSADDIKEIIFQQANYCGVPVGNHAFKVAEQVLRETGKLT